MSEICLLSGKHYAPDVYFVSATDLRDRVPTWASADYITTRYASDERNTI